MTKDRTTIHITNNSSKNITIMAYVITDDCIACGTCIDECPSGAISEGEKYSIDPNSCVDCGTCADVCPSGAIVPGE
jgi:ferredoxin